MIKKKIFISEDTLMKVIGDQLFEQAPNIEPRNISIIMKKIRELFRKTAINHNGYYIYALYYDYSIIKEIERLNKNIHLHAKHDFYDARYICCEECNENEICMRFE